MVIVTVALNYFKGFEPVVVCSLTTNITLILDYFFLSYFTRDSLQKTNFLGVFTHAFEKWGEYMALAIPSAFILCAEWWMYEVLALFAGWLGVLYLATLIIIFNFHNLVYDISYGLSQAASSQIGRTLAELGKRPAKMLLKFIVAIQILICVVISLVYIVGTKSIIGLYTDEEDMIDLFVSCKYLIVIMFIIDSSQIVLGGVIRGIGEQGESSIVSFISYALITLPLTIVFSFWYDMKLHGILLAYICGIIFSTVFNTVILIKSDWELAVSNSDSEEQEVNFDDYKPL